MSFPIFETGRDGAEKLRRSPMSLKPIGLSQAARRSKPFSKRSEDGPKLFIGTKLDMRERGTAPAANLVLHLLGRGPASNLDNGLQCQGPRMNRRAGDYLGGSVAKAAPENIKF